MKQYIFKQLANPVDVHLGAQVRLHRRRLDLSVGELAALVGVTPRAIVAFEAGRQRMLLSKLVAVAAALRTPPAQLYSDIAPAVPPAALAKRAAYLDRLYARVRRRLRRKYTLPRHSPT